MASIKLRHPFHLLLLEKKSSKLWPDEDPLVEMMEDCLQKDFCRQPSFLLHDNSFLPTCDPSTVYHFHFWIRGSTSMWLKREVLIDYIIETASPKLCLNRCMLIKTHKQTCQSVCWNHWREFFSSTIPNDNILIKVLIFLETANRQQPNRCQ